MLSLYQIISSPVATVTLSTTSVAPHKPSFTMHTLPCQAPYKTTPASTTIRPYHALPFMHVLSVTSMTSLTSHRHLHTML